MSETENVLTPSHSLTASDGAPWQIACSQSEVKAPLTQFLEVSNLLLEQVQLNSTHLFRADILRDTSGKLETLAEKEARSQCISRNVKSDAPAGVVDDVATAEQAVPPQFEGFDLHRTIVRRLIPRKPQLDKPLEQSCFIYYSNTSETSSTQKDALVVYIPHCTSSDAMPWYHPKVRGLAYLYSSITPPSSTITATLSIHYLPFPDTPIPLPDRLTRTFQSLLKTIIRLLKLPSKSHQHPTPPHLNGANTTSTPSDISTHPLTPSTLKDTILPQHTVQNTYTLLKQRYAASLISHWIEKTEPSKHVFEDLSIAAFLIELWGGMYGSKVRFNEIAGFVDIACGNGVLVYILRKEGWRGWGFDARRRRTWDVLFGEEMEGCLQERVCVPRPFLDAIGVGEVDGVDVHDGVFERGTFIVSNHADELTCWTPILAALSGGEGSLPFLAIPCCSHGLDGGRKRYTLKEVAESVRDTSARTSSAGEDGVEEEEAQSATGDLKAMRAAKQKASVHGDDKSMYACLTRMTAALAQELGIDVELTLMRIPSTRNIGVVGNRRRVMEFENGEHELKNGVNWLALEDHAGEVEQKIRDLLVRECVSTGGVEASARTWIEKAKKLQGGQGRGKVNLKAHVG
ncbi:tRNA(Ser) Um(44) 2'-O-methyltransferase [Knufia obscura]|uniref:tRNA (uracil-O(2)-)-methyltransferase n=1 Tax=Knufia obscura TaxID=1635080 RepID=A0ABR0RWH4_9EURO|nr:tRNA(Ser) Um(44) 2'-O-methyltransferase [Knufia obscura]